MERRRTFLTLKGELLCSAAPYYIPLDASVQNGELSLLGCNYFYTKPFVLKLLKLTLAALLPLSAKLVIAVCNHGNVSQRHKSS